MVTSVILRFKGRETARVFNRERSRRLPPEIQSTALRKLRMLAAAARLDDLRVPPGNRLEKLRGDREGQWSIAINDQWRICFYWDGSNADAVEIVDYH